MHGELKTSCEFKKRRGITGRGRSVRTRKGDELKGLSALSTSVTGLEITLQLHHQTEVKRAMRGLADGLRAEVTEQVNLASVVSARMEPKFGKRSRGTLSKNRV